MTELILVCILTMAILPRPIDMPEDLREYCAKHPKDCGVKS
jgi:hypothetical protein